MFFYKVLLLKAIHQLLAADGRTPAFLMFGLKRQFSTEK